MSRTPTPRRPRGSLAANPILIGAVTLLVGVVGVFLSYNANNGLPFVPSYEVSVRLPDAAELVPGNDVRQGGSRVGAITAVRAVRTATGAYAVADLKLEKRVGPLPADTKVAVRQRSSLGLKYLEVLPGRAPATVASGGLLRNSGTAAAVDLDDLLDTFDPPSRNGLRTTITSFGVGLAGRGADLNRGVEELPAALGSLSRVAANLAAPQTDLAGFIASAGAAVRGIAPVAPQLGSFFAHAATTFDALNQRVALQASIDRAAADVPGETRDLAAVLPALRDTGTLLRKLQPGARRLPVAATRLATALGDVTPQLAASAPTIRDARPVLTAAQDLAAEPTTSAALRQLSGLAESLVPTLEYVNPMQTRCNYLGLWTRNVPGFINEGDTLGTWFRAQPVVQIEEMLARSAPAPRQHVDYYPDTGQHGTCEAGTTAYIPGRQVIGSTGVPSPDHTENTVPGLGGTR